MPRTSRRANLIEAAATLFHQRGYAEVSLYDIAAAAGMKQGNVYYYFKTKQDLATAVLERWRDIFQGLVERTRATRDPRRKIIQFLDQAAEIAGIYARWGCPIAGLSSELLAVLSPRDARAMPRVYEAHIAFLSAAFAAMGYDAARSRSESYALLSALQGTIHVSHVMNDVEILLAFIRQRKKSVSEITIGARSRSN